jgi:hypothetical protein
MTYRELKVGHIYLGKILKLSWGVKAFGEGPIELVFLVKKTRMEFQCLATNKNNWKETPSIQDFKEFKELTVQDLPLFINYPCVHRNLSYIIKEGVIHDWLFNW